MYKLIAIDIDDTLLTDELTVTEGTIKAMAQAMEKGVIVTLATGRMYASAQRIARQIQLNVPLITYQGSIVKNLLDEKVLYERYVPVEAVRKLFEYAIDNKLHLQGYVNDELYTREDNDKIKAYANMSKIPYHVADNFEELLSKPMPKLLMIDDPDKLDVIWKELDTLFGDQLFITKSKPNFLEFMHPQGTKGSAVKFLASHFGCDLSQVITIGDSFNDKDMIEVAGLGVAMGNAVDALKEIADYITLDNNEEGVKHVIEKFVLQEQA